jgi:hypothetical protein
MEEAKMFKTLFTTRFFKPLGISLLAGTALAVASAPAKAEEKIQPPPYQMAGSNHVIVGVVWEEAAIRKALPPGIEPVKGMTGGINIYSVERGYVIGPYSAAYFWVVDARRCLWPATQDIRCIEDVLWPPASSGFGTLGTHR